MRKFIIFEIGNYDPIIYDEKEIIKEHWKFYMNLDNINPTQKKCIENWIETFNAIEI